MNNNTCFRRIIKKPFFLLLIGIIPVLILYSTNIDQTNFSAILPSLAITAAFSLLLSAVSILLFHKSQNKYLIALIVNLSFFLYGHIYGLLDARSIAGITIGRHAVFLPVSVLATSVFVFLAFRLRQELREFFSLFTNLILIIVFLFTSINIAIYQSAIAPPANQPKKESEPSKNYSISDMPDIYYIVVDGFLREDVLKETYGLSDYRFPEELAKRGFVVPECAHSNYGYTATSIASALNMDYLDALLPTEINTKPDAIDSKIVFSLLHNNKVVEFLKSEGYKFVAFRGFFPGVDFSEADVYFNASVGSLKQDRLSEQKFRELTFWTTLLRPINELVQAYPEKFTLFPKAFFFFTSPDADSFNSRSSMWYQEHMYTLDKMKTLPELEGNVFAYIHLYTTHQPFVLNPDGSQKWPPSETYGGYVDAVDYTSQRLLKIVDSILFKSKQPPIIIIQGDHGFGVTFDRYRIINAYYLPGVDNVVYDTITPVNTFRIIFNNFFGQSLELLPDIIYYENYDGVNFRAIPSTCND